MYGLEYTEVNLLTSKLSKKEFRHILSLTENGPIEIISQRSNIYINLSVSMDIGSLSVNQLHQKINENLKLLRSPLIVDDTHLQIGYNEEDIRQFLPRWIREMELKKLGIAPRINNI
jgi:regulatory protein spx